MDNISTPNHDEMQEGINTDAATKRRPGRKPRAAKAAEAGGAVIAEAKPSTRGRKAAVKVAADPAAGGVAREPAASKRPGRVARADASGQTVARGRQAAPSKVLFAVSEVAPFVATGGMGQVVSSLPAHLRQVNDKLDVRVIAPLYQHVRQQYGAGMTLVGSVDVPLAWRSQTCRVYSMERDGVLFYFIDSELYFDRERIYGYFDDGERFAFFSKAVLMALETIGFVPDIIHAHDWQTALIPIYLKTTFVGRYPRIRSVFSIHNIEYQGQFPLDILADVFELRNEDLPIVEYENCINLVKGAIICSDRLTTVSPSYAEEIRHGGGFGLEHIILMNQGKLSGIINGIDTVEYDPATDPSLTQNYTVDTVEEGKAANKRALQSLFGLPAEPDTPLLCMVSRLAPHKGIDLLLPITESLLQDKLQLLVLGTGDIEYELFFTELAMRNPSKVAVNIAYNPMISDKIYGGADIILIPSRDEPCGLSQMIACRYGAIPLARATGGLRDTVQDCRMGSGNGFLFQHYDSGELLDTIRQAIDMYRFHQDDWLNLMQEAMRTDFSWDLSAKAYADIYAKLR
jgi:starch synthase